METKEAKNSILKGGRRVLNCSKGQKKGVVKEQWHVKLYKAQDFTVNNIPTGRDLLPSELSFLDPYDNPHALIKMVKYILYSGKILRGLMFAIFAI